MSDKIRYKSTTYAKLRFTHLRKSDSRKSILYDYNVYTNSRFDTVMSDRSHSTCRKRRENGPSNNSLAHSSGLYSNSPRNTANIQRLSQFTSYFKFLCCYNNIMLCFHFTFDLDSLSLPCGIV